jgi:hypothetical protein
MAAARAGIRLGMMSVPRCVGAPVRKEEVSRVLEFPLVDAVVAS